MSTDPVDPFDTAFFRGVPTDGPTEILDHLGRPRTYRFPTFFTGTRATTVVTTGSLTEARALVGDAPVFPVVVTPGRCLVALIAFHYGRISDGMTGYHEFAIGIGVSKSRTPLLPALRRDGSHFGLWVLHLPVDSAENCNRGVKIWGLPKVMRRFEDEETDDVRTVTLADGDRRSLRVTLPLAGRAREVAETHRVYSRKGDVANVALTRTHGQVRVRSGFGVPRLGLELGEGAEATTLKRLDVSLRPLRTQHASAMESALYLPTPVA
jgi:hypothetical protein